MYYIAYYNNIYMILILSMFSIIFIYYSNHHHYHLFHHIQIHMFQLVYDILYFSLALLVSYLLCRFSFILYGRALSALSSKRYKVTVFGRNDKDKQRKDKREERGKGKENTRRASKEAKPEHNRA